jgi:hypothetical protein
MGTTESVRALFESARERLRAERRQTVDEQEAFRAFETRLRGMRVGSAPAGASTVPVQRVTTTGLGAVRDAYEATVMAVPHYTEEYNEPYARHVENELGPDVATILTRGEAFDRQYRHVVLSAVSDAQQRRARFIDVLDEEETALSESAGELLGIAEELDALADETVSELSFGALEGHYTRLDTLQTTCEDLVDRRQSTLIEQRRTLQLPRSGPDIAACVYSDLDVDYPVVAATTDLLDAIDTHQQNLVDAISRH